MDWDMIDGLATEAISSLNKGDSNRAIVLLGEIKGHASAMLGISSIWEVVQEDYEAGVAPRALVQKYKQYSITAKEIYNKAHSQNWASPQKIKKAMKPATGKKNIFYPKCRDCEKPFEAYSGHAIICPTCKAFKAMDEGEKRLKA